MEQAVAEVVGQDHLFAQADLAARESPSLAVVLVSQFQSALVAQKL